MVDDLKMIKKHYGEEMMHLCRELFPTILETPGLMYSLMKKTFAPNHYLYEDIIAKGKRNEFKNYIYSLIGLSKEEVEVIKNPFELMDEAGYTLYECKSEEDIQKFRKYYAKGEVLCTFNGGRLDRCHVFFAVKKNVDEIRREDFSNPERQDEYGTSVISIQFARGKVNTLSIKNRYNHKVLNPDATFSNNLDSIIPGLSASFEKKYRFNINQNKSNGFEIPGYVLANDGRYYRSNYEMNNVYYCCDNIIIDNFEVQRDYLEREKYLIVDYFIIDLVKKEVRLYDDELSDSFVDGLRDIKNIQVVKNKKNDGKTIIITPNEGEDIIIEIDKYNRIIGYKNNNLVEVGNSFLEHNEVLENLELSNLVRIGDGFLYSNNTLVILSLPKVENIGDDFLVSNEFLKKIELPKVEIIGDYFLYFNELLRDIKLPKVREVGRYFLYYITKLSVLDLPKLECVGDNFLRECKTILELKLPELKIVGCDFLASNWTLLELDLPKLKEIGNRFMEHNNSLLSVNLPQLETIGDKFLYSNNSLNVLDLPNLETVGDYFMYCNQSMNNFNAPKLYSIGFVFLYCNMFYKVDAAGKIRKR